MVFKGLEEGFRTLFDVSGVASGEVTARITPKQQLEITIPVGNLQGSLIEALKMHQYLLKVGLIEDDYEPIYEAGIETSRGYFPVGYLSTITKEFVGRAEIAGNAALVCDRPDAKKTKDPGDRSFKYVLSVKDLHGLEEKLARAIQLAKEDLQNKQAAEQEEKLARQQAIQEDQELDSKAGEELPDAADNVRVVEGCLTALAKQHFVGATARVHFDDHSPKFLKEYGPNKGVFQVTVSDLPEAMNHVDAYVAFEKELKKAFPQSPYSLVGALSINGEEAGPVVKAGVYGFPARLAKELGNHIGV